MLTPFILVLSMPLLMQGAPFAQHVRTDEPKIRALIEHGVVRSPTFGLLMARLDDTDVIVVIETAVLREGLGGFIPHHVVATGANRYVRVVLNPYGGEEHLIGVLAHEIQHAIEIARAPRVGRSQAVTELLAEIGFLSQGCLRACYETIEAMKVERLVRDELHARRRSRLMRNLN